MKEATRQRIEALEARVAALEAMVAQLRYAPPLPAPTPFVAPPMYQWPPFSPIVTCEGKTSSGLSWN